MGIKYVQYNTSLHLKGTSLLHSRSLITYTTTLTAALFLLDSLFSHPSPQSQFQYILHSLLFTVLLHPLL
ncbi:unnamed protein product [Timema podura]|uniref:Uncharacterized protein n=1 Tax=Timema podura TaxID=61482 RepID=A0ABN7PCC9_TIMPD|nr:unnamed protein product [Timema podura]